MDKDEELARLEAAVYSRAGSAESAVDFIDPVTGETVRATPSELLLRALRAERAEQSAGRGDRDRFARLEDAESASPESLAMPPLPLAPSGSSARRFALPLVAAAAFAVGILLALLVTSAHNGAARGRPEASGNAAVLIFDLPPKYPNLPVPDLGDQFVADSVRNVSGSSPAEDGFGVYLGRETSSNLYCLIVHTDSVLSVSNCSTADDVAGRGLRVRAAVTVRSPVAYGVADGETEVTAVLTPRGEFSMSFPPPGEQPATEPLPTSLEPPARPGDTVLGTWTSADGDFQATLDAHGEGLVIALDCVGEGTVTVHLSDGGSSQFDCTSFSVDGGGFQMNMAYEAFYVTVFTTGNVVWGLTIASTPVTEETEGK